MGEFVLYILFLYIPGIYTLRNYDKMKKYKKKKMPQFVNTLFLKPMGFSFKPWLFILMGIIPFLKSEPSSLAINFGAAFVVLAAIKITLDSFYTQ